MPQKVQALEISHGPNGDHCCEHYCEYSVQIPVITELVPKKCGEYSVELIADYNQKRNTNTKTRDQNRKGGHLSDFVATHLLQHLMISAYSCQVGTKHQDVHCRGYYKC